METGTRPVKKYVKQDSIRKAAKVMLIVLLLNVVGQLASVYQTRFQLKSPLIPESVIWEINGQIIFHAMVSAIGGLVGLLLFFFDKCLWVIVLVALVLIREQFIYV